MMMKKACLFLLSGIFVSSFCYAQELWDNATQEVCHKAIRAVYQTILEAKDLHQELSEFDERALSKNPQGIDQIFYQYKDPRLPQKYGPYEFLITITPLKEKPSLQPDQESKQYGFPLIGVRVSRLIKKHRMFHHYDLDQAVNKGLDLLYAHQQQYFPFEMVLKPLKESFKVGERIEFEVMVKSKTNQNLKIKNLGEKTLFFTINGQEWGTKPSVASGPGQEEYILEPHNSLSRSFKGDSFKKSGEVEIFCTYNLGYKGILPFGILRIKIVE